MSWEINGNNGNPAGSYLGTTDNQPLIIKTGWSGLVGTCQRLQIDSDDPATTTLRFYTSEVVAASPGRGPAIPAGLAHMAGKESWALATTVDAFSIGSVRSEPSGATVGLNVLSLLSNGNVGIGVANPAEKLDVAGDAHMSGSIKVDGDVVLTGGADCAEDFDINGTEKVDPGTVMVLDQDGALRQSEQAYDKRVAGVISGAGDFKPAITLDKQKNPGKKRLPLALVGKVFCKVDAQYSAVEVGDLLTTSPTTGYAMKVADPLKAFGAVIGKALRPMQSGQGLIPILVALQ